jgi:hypothetical protein
MAIAQQLITIVHIRIAWAWSQAFSAEADRVPAFLQEHRRPTELHVRALEIGTELLLHADTEAISSLAEILIEIRAASLPGNGGSYGDRIIFMVRLYRQRLMPLAS